jgi:hypothetical protein
MTAWGTLADVGTACNVGAGLAMLLFQEFGFLRDRRIAKWCWVMRLRVPER